MKTDFIKRTVVIGLAVIVVLTCISCGMKNRKQAKEKPEEGTTEEKQKTPDYVKKGVKLPEDFGDMIYPMEAIMIQSYVKELPYYTPDSDEDEADSFWFSMAVLTSQMNHNVKDVAVRKGGRFIYISDETMNMYAAALYDSFGKGNMEFPQIHENVIYAVYDEDNDLYGFIDGSVGELKPYITSCKKTDDGYVLKMELKDGADSDKTVKKATLTIVPTSYDEKDNAFAYSIQKFRSEDSKDDDKSDDGKKDDKSDDDDDEEESSDRISKDKALELAQDYFGKDAEYTYKKIEHIEDVDYYDFAVEGEGVTSSDVLVSVDGDIVMGATKNDDEEDSWTFDQ